MVEYLSTLLSEEYVQYLDTWLNDWGFTVSLAVLAIEFIRQMILRTLTWNIIGDAVTNYITLAMFFGLNYLMIITFYIAGFYLVYEYFSVMHLPINGWTILAAVVIADLIYYWEHRFMHRCGIGWATHTVHHSSPYFNISVAYRFGPLDGVMPFFFHIPMAMLGFNPIIIFLAEAFVQLFQALLHTEVVKKLPRPFEAIFNTPSHHRVHHGSNPEYIDKNYAGIFIIWDKMFGTFAEEKDKVIYGITTPLDSINPWTVFTHGLKKLAIQVWEAKGFINKINYIIKPPGWEPKEKVD